MIPLDKSYDLEQMFPRESQFAILRAARLGVVVGGSLSKGLVVKLDMHQRIEDLAVGRYVVVHSHDPADPAGTFKRFFCMITDIVLDNTNPEIQSNPPDISDPFLRAIYSGTAAYGKIHVQPMLSIETDDQGNERVQPVKTIPSHFMDVHNATLEEVNRVFGQEDEDHFFIGAPLELPETQINLNLDRLVERSIGVFGKSGTGKSFLTRMLLAGVISKRKAVSLVFDMHNDYGGYVRNETGQRAKGLKELLSDQVSICTLDSESTRRRNAPYDFEIKIGYNEIEPEDLEMLRETMNLSDAMLDAAHTLRKRYGHEWVRRLIDITAEDIDDIEASSPTRSGTLAALQRRVQRFERWSFLVPESAGDSVSQIIGLLVDKRKSVILEFGRYGNSLEAYILVANYLTRRIHERYVEAVERALGDSELEPPQLLITIEEAHKFLDPHIANQTIFGIIARELRKYKVTLLVVDQRPSGIDEEVMSQIGTRVTALLDNERDINAVLMGISGANSLREVLARLDTRQQAIIMGHAVPMPVVIRTRDYDESLYESLLRGSVHGATLPPGERLSLSGKRERRLR